MLQKVILIGLALVSLSFFFVPTYMLEYAPTETGAIKTTFDARCDACHFEEQEEFSNTKIHITLKCGNCHNISEFGPDLYSHKATTIDCIDCHIEQAGRFKNDAHMKGEKMCSACHSHIRIQFERLVFNGTNTSISLVNGSWEISNSLSGGRYIKTVSYPLR